MTKSKEKTQQFPRHKGNISIYNLTQFYAYINKTHYLRRSSRRIFDKWIVNYQFLITFAEHFATKSHKMSMVS